jgi:hypothetical protein
MLAASDKFQHGIGVAILAAHQATYLGHDSV